MDSVIEALWNGDIHPQEGELFDTPAYKALLREADADQEALEKSFTAEQWEKWEKLSEVQDRMTVLMQEIVFSYAFRLGGKLMLEVKGEKGNS